MTIISSQHYLNWEIVESKIEQLTKEGASCVEIPCYDAGEIDGEAYAVMMDKHHTLTAARELGLEVVFDVIADPEGLTGETLLEARYIDGDYYDVKASDMASEKFALVF